LEEKGCNAKSGNPFGPFWDTFDVNFTDSMTYGPLHYDVYHTSVAKDWNLKFPGALLFLQDLPNRFVTN